MKSNVATAVGAATAEVGVTVYDFARVEISAEEAGERIGLAHEGIHECAVKVLFGRGEPSRE